MLVYRTSLLSSIIDNNISLLGLLKIDCVGFMGLLSAIYHLSFVKGIFYVIGESFDKMYFTYN